MMMTAIVTNTSRRVTPPDRWLLLRQALKL
jgi:hypothetical protein